MRARTKGHRIERDSVTREEEKSISADDYLEQVYGDFPRWAISLAGLRYRENLTQKQLGEIIGVKQSNISLMERGLRPKVFKTDYRIFL